MVSDIWPVLLSHGAMVWSVVSDMLLPLGAMGWSLVSDI